MKIALPLTGEQLSLHLVIVLRLLFFTINPQTKKLLNRKHLPTPHESGVFPSAARTGS